MYSFFLQLWQGTCHLLALISILIPIGKMQPKFRHYDVINYDEYGGIIEDDAKTDEAPIGIDPLWLFYGVELPITMFLVVDHVLSILAYPRGINGKWYGVFNISAIIGVYSMLLCMVLLWVWQPLQDAKRAEYLATLIMLSYSLVMFRAFRFIHAAQRHSLAARVLFRTLATSWRQLLLVGTMTSMLAVGFANIVYVVESGRDESHFLSAVDALWWSVQTLTTVGYGDMRPIGYAGRAVAAMCMLCGVFAIALSVAMVTMQLSHVQEVARGLPVEKRKEEGACGTKARGEAGTGDEQMRLKGEGEMGESSLHQRVNRYMDQLKKSLRP